MKKFFISTILAIAATVSFADDPADFTIPANAIYSNVPSNCPPEILISSITNREAYVSLFQFEKWSRENQVSPEMWASVDNYAYYYFEAHEKYTPWISSRYDELPKVSNIFLKRIAEQRPWLLEYETLAFSNKTHIVSNWSIKEIVRSVPGCDVEKARDIIARKYMKEIKIALRKKGKSFVEYIDPKTGEKVNPLENYANALQTALTAPGFGNLSEILSEIDIEVQTVPIPTNEEIEEIKWKILIDELKIDPYQNRLLYWLGTDKFNEFVDEYNNGKPANQ